MNFSEQKSPLKAQEIKSFDSTYQNVNVERSIGDGQQSGVDHDQAKQNGLAGLVNRFVGLNENAAGLRLEFQVGLVADGGVAALADQRQLTFTAAPCADLERQYPRLAWPQGGTGVRRMILVVAGDRNFQIEVDRLVRRRMQ